MSDDERIASIIGEWQASRDQGQSVSPETVIQAHPELADGLRAKFDALAQLDNALAEADRSLRALPADRYTDFKPVGMGGMGIVYWAIDQDLNREVAFKVIRPGTENEADKPSDPGVLSPPPADTSASEFYAALKQRFLQEAWITSGMAHPGIVPIYELGQTSEGVPYYTMRFIKGERTLASAIEEVKGQAIEERLGLLEPFLKVCDTLRYAHSRGVIHRDLKPENIALGEFGEVVLLDWGLAKPKGAADPDGDRMQAHLQAYREATDMRTVSAMGTPGYMAPEAAMSKSEDMDERSDVYSLGAMLFEILTGRLPFEFETFGELAQKLLKEKAPKASEVDPTVPRALAALCARCLAREPGSRPKSVDALAEAVRAWQQESAANREVRALMREADRALEGAEGLHGEALLKQLDRVTALSGQVLKLRPDHKRTKMLLGTVKKKRAQAIDEREQAILDREHEARRRLKQKIGVAAALLVALGVAVSAWIYASGQKTAWTATGRADADRERAREAEERAIETGAQATEATRLAAQAKSEAEAERKAREAADERVRVADAQREAALAKARDALAAKKQLAASLQEEREGREKAEAWAQAELQAKRATQSARLEAEAAFAKERARAEQALANGERLLAHRRKARAAGLAYAAMVERERNPALAALLARESLRLDNTALGARDLREAFITPQDLREQIVAKDAFPNSPGTFSPDGSRYVICAADKTVRVFDGEGNTLRVLKGIPSAKFPEFLPDGKRFVTHHEDTTARVWDLRGKELAVLRGHKAAVTRVEVSPDGVYLLTSSPDGSPRLWTAAGKLKAAFKRKEGGDYRARFSPKGDRIVSWSQDGTARIWDLRGNELRVLTGHSQKINDAHFSPDGARVLTAGYDHTARIWDVTTGKSVVLRGHGERLHAGSFSPDGALAATTSPDGTCRIWTMDGSQVTSLRHRGGRTWSPYPTFHPSGTVIATSKRWSAHVCLWDLKGTLLARLGGHESRGTVAFSPDGSRFVTIDARGWVRFWGVTAEQLTSIGKLAVTREFSEEERKRYADLLVEK